MSRIPVLHSAPSPDESGLAAGTGIHSVARPQTRDFLVRTMAGLVIAAFAPAALAQRKAPAAGTEYRVVNPPQATETPGKIEVLEFFWYACPHCAALEPVLKEWVKQLPADVVFRRAHVPFNEIKHQQLFYTLETLGKTAQADDKVFAAIHVDRNRMDSIDRIAPVLEKAGIDRKSFTEAWESFSVQTRMRKATALASAYKVDSVPMIAVNGKYLTSPSMAGGNQGVLQVVDYLIAQERAAKK